jgi:hypothetical protein
LKNFIVISFILLSLNSFAQKSPPGRILYFGLTANAYKGDLSTTYNKWDSGISFGALMNKKKRVNGDFNFNIGNVTGENGRYSFEEDEETVYPNTFFTTRFTQVTFNLKVNIISLPYLKVFVGQGFGLTRINPLDEFNESLFDQNDTRADNESYVTSVISTPQVIGGHFFFPNGITLGLKARWLRPQTDYIDNIGLWGSTEKKDQILQWEFAIGVPINIKSLNEEPKPVQAPQPE